MRLKLIILVVRGLAAMMIGYAIIVLLTSLGFNGVLGGRPLYGGSPIDLAGGMMVAIISGLAGGLVPLIGDTIYVLFFFKKSTAPFWFDALASATLMACTVLGGILRERIKSPRKTMV
jgi:hypothetical protein